MLKLGKYLYIILKVDVFFVQWHINLLVLFNAKAILLEGHYWYYSIYNWEELEGSYILERRGAHSVMVIVLGIGCDDLSSNPGSS